MTGTSSAKTLSRLWFLLVGMVTITVLYLAKVLFLPLAFAILFAFLLSPLVGLLERLRLSRALASVLVIVGFAILLGTAGWMLFTQLVDVTNDLPTYTDNIETKMAAIHSPSDSAFSRAQQEVEKLGEELGAANTFPAPKANATDAKSTKKPLGSSAQTPVQVREVARPTGRLDQLGGVLEPLTTAFLSVVFTFFVLLQRGDLRNRLIRLSGDHNLTVMTQAMHDASLRISRYFLMQLAVNVVYGLAFATVLYVIRLPHPLLFGTLAGLGRFVPFIGPPLAALVPTVLSLAVFHGWSKSLLIVCTFVLLEVITANFAEPRIYGRHTGLSALAILVAAAFWTLIWGPVGLILSVPLTVCLVVIGRHVPSLEFLTVMLGDKPAIPPWTCFYQRLLARDQREAGEILESSLRDRSLEEAYDEVLIPALILSEEDRLHGDLEDAAARYIRQVARELIEEVGFRENAEAERNTNEGMEDQRGPGVNEVPPLRVMCIPMRDEMDELAASMLCQSLQSGNVEAITTQVRRISEVLEDVSAKRPDIAFLSGLPPFGIARLNRIYGSLRMQNPRLRIMVGVWKYSEDVNALAQQIGRGEEVRVLTRITEAVAVVRALARGEIPSETAAQDFVPDRSAA